jgi:uncharacterized protein YkwD
MNHLKLFISGIAAAVTFSSVSPAFARPAFAPIQNDNYGYQTNRAFFNEALEREVLSLVNALRYKKGLSELRSDNRGLKSARLAAKEAGIEGGFGDIDNSLFDRLSAQGLDLSRRMYGETRAIIEDDFDADVETQARLIVKRWMKNAKFSKVIFSEDLSYAGIAAYVNKDGETMVVLNAFGAEFKPAPQPQPPRGGCGGY